MLVGWLIGACDPMVIDAFSRHTARQNDFLGAIHDYADSDDSDGSKPKHFHTASPPPWAPSKKLW